MFLQENPSQFELNFVTSLSSPSKDFKLFSATSHTKTIREKENENKEELKSVTNASGGINF